jgi:hypothetical protein
MTVGTPGEVVLATLPEHPSVSDHPFDNLRRVGVAAPDSRHLVLR